MSPRRRPRIVSWIWRANAGDADLVHDVTESRRLERSCRFVSSLFMLFSRREDNAKDLESFASEKGKILSLNDRNILFRCIFYDFLWELPKNGAKSSAKSCDISTVF